MQDICHFGYDTRLRYLTAPLHQGHVQDLDLDLGVLSGAWRHPACISCEVAKIEALVNMKKLRFKDGLSPSRSFVDDLYIFFT